MLLFVIVMLFVLPPPILVVIIPYANGSLSSVNVVVKGSGVGHQQLQCADIGLIGIGALAQVSLALGGFLVQDMRLVGFGSLDLTVFGQLKALFCTGVGFQLGHFIFLLNLLLLLIGGGRLRVHKHDHTAALQLGGLFHIAYIGTGLCKALHDTVPQLGMRHLTAAEADGHLDAVAGRKELLGLVHLGIKIVGINVQGKPGLLHLYGLLVLPGFLFALGLLKAVFAVIHNAAYRRLGLRRYLYEIQVLFLRHVVGIAGGHDPQLLAFSTDHSYFLVADLFIDLMFHAADW